MLVRMLPEGRALSEQNTSTTSKENHSFSIRNTKMELLMRTSYFVEIAQNDDNTRRIQEGQNDMEIRDNRICIAHKIQIRDFRTSSRMNVSITYLKKLMTNVCNATLFLVLYSVLSSLHLYLKMFL